LAFGVRQLLFFPFSREGKGRKGKGEEEGKKEEGRSIQGTEGSCFLLQRPRVCISYPILAWPAIPAPFSFSSAWGRKGREEGKKEKGGRGKKGSPETFRFSLSIFPQEGEREKGERKREKKKTGSPSLAKRVLSQSASFDLNSS